MSELFTRRLSGGESGPDVEAVGRALCHGGYFVPIRVFAALPRRVRRTYGRGKKRAVNRLKKAERWPEDGIYTRSVCYRLADDGCFKPYEEWLLEQYDRPHEVELVYPIGRGFDSWICQRLHWTSGLPGKAGYDFCVPEITGNGAPIVAVERGEITRLSGSDPRFDTWDSSGVFGWSVYYRTPTGREYYVTHIGRRPTGQRLGQKVEPGTIIGYVGDQRFRPDHVHYSVSSPLGPGDAARWIERISSSPRVLARAA